MKKIAIIGAGFSGLTLATRLAGFAEVHLFEKARGVGGRMSTRYADPFSFDHGAQFFTARTEAFKAFLKPFIAQGVVAEWAGKTIILEAGKSPDKNIWFEPHYVAVPTMNNLCKTLAASCLLSLTTEVAPLGEKQRDGWHLVDKNGDVLGCFDWVISTAPPVQTKRLFSSHLTPDAACADIKLLGCYALLIGFAKRWDKQWIAARIRENPLQWVGVNSSKPGRNADVTSLVVHSRNDWAEEHIDDDMDEAQAYLVNQFQQVTGIDCTAPDYLSTHRWRYATLEKDQQLVPYLDAAAALASVSDWCSASRVEDVWINACKLAASIQAAL